MLVSIDDRSSQLDFFLSFFSHLTALISLSCPAVLTAHTAAASESDDGEGSWKGVDEREGSNSFEAAWTSLPEEKRAAVKALCAKDSDALLAPETRVPAAFPTLPLGMECFIDEASATSALAAIPGLQYRHYTLVPKKVRAAHHPGRIVGRDDMNPIDRASSSLS